MDERTELLCEVDVTNYKLTCWHIILGSCYEDLDIRVNVHRADLDLSAASFQLTSEATLSLPLIPTPLHESAMEVIWTTSYFGINSCRMHCASCLRLQFLKWGLGLGMHFFTKTATLFKKWVTMPADYSFRRLVTSYLECGKVRTPTHPKFKFFRA